MSDLLFPFRLRRDRLRQRTGQGWLLLYKGGEYFNDNLYYLTGLDSFYTLALISLETDQELILTNSIEFSAVESATDISDVKVCDSGEIIKRLIDLFSFYKITLLYCDYGLDSRAPLPAEIVDHLKAANPKLEISGLPDELLEMRMIKEPGELKLIRKGISVIEQLFAELPNFIKPGVAEAELSALIYQELVRNGFNRFYDIFVASGANSAIPFYRANNSLLPPDHVVLIDICAAIDDYVIDITRTFPTSDEFPQHIKEYYSIIRQVQQQAIDTARCGSTLEELSIDASRSFRQNGLDAFYLNKIGHFVGLAPDDPGDRNTLLQKDMTITIEPGLYFANEGFGLRVEDTIIL